MSILHIVKSLKKSYQISKLQKRIRPKVLSVQDLMLTEDKSFELYLKLCEKDSGVRAVIEKYSLSESDLREVFHGLERSGAGQWIRGHYVPLSTIAYGQSLEIYMIAKKFEKRSDMDIALRLVGYFSN